MKKQIVNKLRAIESPSLHNGLPVVWREARGCYVWDTEDKRYIDFTSGICVANAGHSNPNICRALKNQIDNNLLYCYVFPNEIRLNYTKELLKHTPKFCERVLFFSSGTESCEAAYKLMKLYGQIHGKQKIVSFYGSMHGKTLASEFLRGREPWIGYLTPEIIHLPFPSSSDTFQQWIDFYINNGFAPKNIAGFMIETYRGWDAKFYPKNYIQELANFAKKIGALLCFDEIQGGFGRTGKLFNFEHYGVEPDLVCCGKGMSSSLPLSAVLGRKKILDIPPWGMTSTFSANPLCLTAGLANLKEILEILPTVKEKGVYLHKLLRTIKKYEVNGRGLLAAIITKTKEEADTICYKSMNKGLLLIKTGLNSVKIAPPLIITKDIIKKGVEIIKESIKEI